MSLSDRTKTRPKLMKRDLCRRDAALAFLLAASLSLPATADSTPPEPFQRENLVAWCIVPFDANQRGPAERAAMVNGLGLRRVAYDWRQKHVAEFEEEILQYKKHGIEYFAFWSWHDAIEPLIRKHDIRPQIWITCSSPEAADQDGRVEAAAKALIPLAEKTKRLGLSLGLYNHGGWGGEPENMVAVCRYLRNRYGFEQVGLVYNFHHGHGHVERFGDVLRLMKPYLLCVNLNGMNDAEAVRRDASQKILPIGSGKHEASLIKSLIASGYEGPVGILGHRADIDVEVALRKNLDGLNHLLETSDSP